jgi:large subunit ribosomal protein L1
MKKKKVYKPSDYSEYIQLTTSFGAKFLCLQEHNVEGKNKMADIEQQLREALIELRKTEERKFVQTVDFIINLQKFDLKKTPISLLIKIPHKSKDKKVAGFFETKSQYVDTIIESEFKNYAEKNKLKQLAKKYDFFIAQAKLMPKVATVFGKVLGPSGKMPSPQLGILLNADEKAIAEVKEKINTSIKIKLKEASIKLSIGKQNMKDSEIIENAMAIYNELLKHLPKERDNVKNLEIKFTMTKPIKIKLK